MLKDDSARVPFAVIGILMIILSTVTAAYLLKMDSLGVSNAITDEREGELNDAIAFSTADMDSALNIACIYAEEETGENPIINVSDKCPYPGSADDVNLIRLRQMAYRNFSQYLAANYGDNFVYGDYVVSACPDGDSGSVGLEPVAMNISRTVFHPILQCNTTYDAYYVASVPVRLHITRPGTTFDYTETYEARTLVTSRYPLLKEMTDEYESRLNGSAMLTDMTAASFAYTWARGYCQYFTAEPMNIVDNGDLELMANAASLLEQGCVYNSVDPVSLASLVQHTYDNTQSTKDVVNHSGLSYINQYNFSNTSKKSLPENKEPEEYRFNADSIVDNELKFAVTDPVSRYNVDRAYGCRMHITLTRKPLSTTYNDSGSICKESYPLVSKEDGRGPFFREIWKVWTNNSEGNGWTEEVTVDYVMDECSLLLSNNDVLKPHDKSPVTLEGRSYTDSNLAGAVDGYNKLVNTGEILMDRDSYPDGYSGPVTELSCEHNEWVGSESVTELKGLAFDIKGDVAVTLKPSDYGSYDEMMNAAYGRMLEQFRKNYSRYEEKAEYMDDGEYISCGAKYVFYKRSAFLDRVDDALNASVNASQEIDKKVDDQLKNYSSSMNSSTMKDNARSSKDLLDNTKMFIPFGLNMTLSGGEGKADPYKWEEDVSLAVDQRPNYLGTDNYTDPETGYTVRPLKVRNVCVFALPTDVVDSAEANEAVLDGIDAVSGTAYRMANDTVTAESTKLIKDVSDQAKQEIKDEINDALVHDDDLQGQVTRDDVESAVNNAFNSRTPEQAVQDLNNGTLQQEIAGDLGEKAKAQAERELAKRSDQYVDTYGDYIEGKTEEAVTGAEEKAVSGVIDAMSGCIKQTFKDFIAAAADHTEDQAVSAALKRIPMGLPLLPPWGWWATMNVWYIEIKGEIPYLAVYDTDNEPVPDAILGQRATVYVRRPMLDIRDGDNILGSNEPIRFHQQTCVFIIVPPGEQGIGDKSGGWEEKSPGFDEAGST